MFSKVVKRLLHATARMATLLPSFSFLVHFKRLRNTTKLASVSDQNQSHSLSLVQSFRKDQLLSAFESIGDLRQPLQLMSERAVQILLPMTHAG